MNILSVKKQNDIDGNFDNYKVIISDSTNIRFVPLSEANTDYQEIMKWVAEGNVIEEAD